MVRENWLGLLPVIIPAAVILIVVILEARRWAQSRRREKEMARALSRYLERQ
ncbi:MAG TPA: hypothetical protein VNJ11_12250 [Bryobacteraceae bacterium]|nr:hypothetical protein [Bryobacteraceae bacterium]